jgi:fumarylacetoacetase
MSAPLDRSHDPSLRSWVASANVPGTEFPIQNLPFGVFRRTGGDEPGLGAAIGERVLDLRGAVQAGLLDELPPLLQGALCARTLNGLLACDRADWSAVRQAVSALLGTAATRRPEADLLPAIADVELLLPIAIGDYTDFYASLHHATSVGRMFRPEQPLFPNYKYVPIAYHGRASSIVVSATPIRRPSGQLKADADPVPAFAPTRALDYECEVGMVIGGENPLGSPVPIGDAPRRLFGFCLLNDWSARDLQRWEYQPLGPFLSKSFATTISPWIVTAEALAPFHSPAGHRAEGDPPPLPHLHDPADQANGALDVQLEVLLRSERMRAAGLPPHRVSTGRLLDLYWTPAQLVAHHTSNGCNLRPGDLLASGTVSGAAEDSRGCLLELTSRGSRPLALPGGETRRFLEDGDEVILRGRCVREGFVAIGFGECRGKVIP